MIKFTGTSALQAHPVNEFGAIIDGAAIANILGGGTESMTKFIGTSALQYHPVDEQGNIIDATAIANAVNGSLSINSKQPAPSTSFILDSTGGDDENNGFTAPVQSFSRLEEVLNSYFWKQDNIFIAFLNYVGGDTLDLNGVEGIKNLSLSLSGNTLTNDFNISGGSIPVISVVGGTFDNCRSVVSDSNYVNFVSPVFINRNTSNCVEGNRVRRLDILNFTLTDCSCDQIVKTENVDSVDLALSFLSGTNSFDLFAASISLGHVKINGLIATIPGKIIDISADQAGGASFDINLANLSETTPSTYPAQYSLNGVAFPDLVPKGSFDDNADALTGGLTAGDFYVTTGLGANPLNVAGIVMQVQ